jgi:hypothetical protein
VSIVAADWVEVSDQVMHGLANRTNLYDHFGIRELLEHTDRIQKILQGLSSDMSLFVMGQRCALKNNILLLREFWIL